uniref:Uncharacterized protein n=1 Tax=Tanacetum cinerariifolium TaxID=118510 RepID=A0A6L2K973_TANCI|nr:hypothetical protein [Tanacetum cinerariifolium]
MEMKDTLSSCSNSEEQQMHKIQDKAKKSCMVSFRQLHSHLNLLSNNDLKGTRTADRFKRAFVTLFRQDVEIFAGTMFLNVDQIEKQLDKEEFKEIGFMDTFRILETQFQKFIKPRISLNDEDGIMARKYFLEYTKLEARQLCDTLIQHMESVKKSIDERTLHKREYDTRVNERQMQTTKGKVDTCKVLDAILVYTASSGTESLEQNTSSRPGNDAHANDADIRPIYDEEPMDEGKEFSYAKPHHMIAPGSASYNSNDMVRNHYLEESKKQTHEIGRNSKTSVMPSARAQSTANGSKSKPRINNQKSRNWPASKSSCVTTKTVPIAEHSRNFRKFSDSKHFVCSTCQKCVFNANHDHCVTKFLNEVNSHPKEVKDLWLQLLVGDLCQADCDEFHLGFEWSFVKSRGDLLEDDIDNLKRSNGFRNEDVIEMKKNDVLI